MVVVLGGGRHDCVIVVIECVGVVVVFVCLLCVCLSVIVVVSSKRECFGVIGILVVVLRNETRTPDVSGGGVNDRRWLGWTTFGGFVALLLLVLGLVVLAGEISLLLVKNHRTGKIGWTGERVRERVQHSIGLKV